MSSLTTIIDKTKLLQFISGRISKEMVEQVSAGIAKSPMSISLTSYILSRMNCNDFYNCPIRKQFIPINDEIIEDHPIAKFDSLNEQHDSPVEGLVHRYPSKVLFLSSSICPVYCRFCTRSYSIGGKVDVIDKLVMRPALSRWETMFKYIRENKQIDDVVVSGGDVFMLNDKMLDIIGNTLLDIDHIKHIIFATKGIAVMPMKIISDTSWTNKIIELVSIGRERGKHVAIHTHLNHPNEISDITREACSILFKNHVTVRNQTVLMRSINDNVGTMKALLSQLISLNIYPYYVYQHDIVKGTEYFRTPLSTILNMDKQIRGMFAGFNTPNFVVDLMGGGGKRLASTYDSYDRTTGISIFESYNNKKYYHVDPLHSLKGDMAMRWIKGDVIIDKNI